MTNFKSIQKMDTDELADFLCDNIDCSICFNKKNCDNDITMLDWLKQEAEI